MNAEQKWQEARDYLNNKPTEAELQKAISLIQEAVEENHAGAYFTLAMLYLSGIGFEQDKQKAFDLLQKSHALGYERSKLMLATFLIEGEFVEKDVATAEQYLRELAEQGDVDACAHLSQKIFDDTFPNDNKDEGVVWLRKAAEMGHPTAMARLGQICGNRCQDDEAHFWFEKAKAAGVEGVEEAEEQYSQETYSQRRVEYIRYCLSVKDYSSVTEIIERDANDGDTEAIYLIADFYINGMGDEQNGIDIERGLKIYEEMSSKGDAHADYRLGQLYGRGPIEQDYEKAIMYYRKSAEAGYPDAQYAVGCIYNDGLIGEVNKEEATKWIELAAEQNQRDALCLLAFSYIQDASIGTLKASNLSYGQNIEKGFDFLMRAAGSGQPSALYVFAQCYHEGKYLDKDDEQAFFCLQKSVMSEAMPDNMNLMGDFFRDGIGTEQNYEIAAMHYQWAADNGNTSAMMSLANLYEEGLGVEKNEELAAELKNRWWETIQWNIYGIMPLDFAREQAKTGNEEAMYQLGQRYQQGNGVEQNIEIASDWWHKAAMKDYIPACYDLGVYYVFTKHDIERGMKWLNKAVDADYTLSYRVLGDIYFNGWGVDADTEKGIELLTKAAEQDHEDTQLRLVGIYHEGENVEKDYEKARFWFEKYLAHDSAEANYRMGRCLFEGDMYDQDYTQALAYFTKAVKGGCHDASPYYLNMLWYGNHVNKNQEEVLSTYKELSDNNDAQATYILYTLYKDEEYEYKNVETAISYLQKSVEMGYDEALKEMGLQYLEEGLFDTDIDKANDYFAQAAERGNAVALINLAISYQIGRGFEVDINKAVQLYAKATEQGETYGICQIYRLILSDEYKVSTEEEKTYLSELLERAASQNAEASYLLAFTMLFRNESDDYSWERESRAAAWMSLAADNGYADAVFNLANMCIEGRGVDVDLEKAKQLLDSCIANGYRVDNCKKIIDEDLSGDAMGAEYKKFIYWYGIVSHNKDKEYLDEENGMKFLEVACDAALCGELNAQKYCGKHFLQEDPDKAQEFFTLAIKQSGPGLAMALGQMYMFGNGVDEDMQRAASYFQIGAEMEDMSCTMYLAHIYGMQEDKEMRNIAKGLYSHVYSNSEKDSSEEKTARYYYGKMICAEIEEGNSLDDYESSELVCLYFYCHVIGKFKLAGDAFVKIAEQTDNLDILNVTPYIYVFAGDNQTAYEIIDYCMKNIEDKDKVLIQKGIVDALTCNDEQALINLNREAIFGEDDGYPSKELYATLLYKLGRYNDVIDFAERVEQCGNAKAELILYKGKAYRALEKEKEAIDCFISVSEMDVDNDNELASAHAFLLLNKYEECREAITNGLDMLDDSLEYAMCFAYNNAAYYHILMGDNKEAIDYFMKSVETGYLTFDYMKEYKPELYNCPEIKEYIDNFK